MRRFVTTALILGVGALAVIWTAYEATRCVNEEGFIYCTFWFKFWLLGWR